MLQACTSIKPGCKNFQIKKVMFQTFETGLLKSLFEVEDLKKQNCSLKSLF